MSDYLCFWKMNLLKYILNILIGTIKLVKTTSLGKCVSFLNERVIIYLLCDSGSIYAYRPFVFLKSDGEIDNALVGRKLFMGSGQHM